ncbi:N-acetylmuramoyl-L-alanine amidase [Pelagovum pacificum]|uniref:N-acetylmuramoyl-L-alanine amidase n=1 Tax=Pelagovum pacificum TaxID=2588711 RepID=A0A5C5G8K0_9RHOB|nr:N-acetylmuramoyl-L-alanine amidase [Pelagovum pacificum]QQA41592.1 N-acetylmuramoyl-L-alanine amidase [Pelagovum pacificum]TNY30871.1 N-acetylmuramoyl-L-alanine amidase [Pelagovum pacificum]
MTDSEALWHPSPNFGARRGGALPDMIVLHFTAMESCDAARDRLCAPEHEVSSHYLISAEGALLQLVAEDQRAWHAGAGAWGPVTDVNSRSIGIELDNRGIEPFPETQLLALERLLERIMVRWTIPPERIVGHSDTAPDRKKDPGPLFPWKRLADAGLSIWPEVDVPEPEEIATPERSARLTAALTTFGYRGPQAIALFHACRMRFRPAGGAFDTLDLAMAEDLAARFPVKME